MKKNRELNFILQVNAMRKEEDFSKIGLFTFLNRVEKERIINSK